MYTYSEGEGDKRHVVISPKSPDAQADQRFRRIWTQHFLLLE